MQDFYIDRLQDKKESFQNISDCYTSMYIESGDNLGIQDARLQVDNAIDFLDYFISFIKDSEPNMCDFVLNSMINELIGRDESFGIVRMLITKNLDFEKYKPLYSKVVEFQEITEHLIDFLTELKRKRDD